MRTTLTAFCLFISALAFAQVQLGPCINTGALPSSADSIQPYLPYIDTTQAFMNGGYQVGETVNDFILYDINNTPYQLSTILNCGKPVLLVSGSYSCPAFRYCMAQVIPDLIAIYDTNVVFLVAYQMEAHPVGPDHSPYSDTVFTTGQNYQDGILIPQHRIYADRKNRAAQSQAAFGYVCPLMLDGPGNEFWSTYGPSPNNGYLITKDGWVFNKYGWMMNSKITAMNDIAVLLTTVGIQPAHNSTALVSPLVNPGTAGAMLTSVSATPLSLTVTNALGQVVISATVAPFADFAIGEALGEDGIYTIVLTADDRSQIITFVKAE